MTDRGGAPVGATVRGTGVASNASSRAYWRCQLAGWGAYVVFTAWQIVYVVKMGRARALTETLAAALLGIALTHALRAGGRLHRWLALGGAALALRLALASVGLAAALVVPLAVLEAGVFGDRPDDRALVVVFAVLRWTFVFFIWLATYVTVHLTRGRARGEIDRLRLEKALQLAELRALKSQLNPHFLFNALNTVRALIPGEPARAETAVMELARLLRYTLGAGAQELVPMAAELRIVDDYLALEALRLGDRLTVVRDIPRDGQGAVDLETTRIPVMLLQTLVENAVKHGIATLPAGGTLRIAMSRASPRTDGALPDGAFEIDVENPRPTSPAAAETAETADDVHVGLANARERLRLLLGPAATLHLDLSVPGRAFARVRIPA